MYRGLRVLRRWGLYGFELIYVGSRAKGLKAQGWITQQG